MVSGSPSALVSLGDIRAAAAGLAGARPTLPPTESVGLSEDLARKLRAGG